MIKARHRRPRLDVTDEPKSTAMAGGTLPPIVPRKHWRDLVATRPFAAFVALAYLWSWIFWIIAALVPGALGVSAHYIGGFGPLLSAVIVIWAQGRSVSGWVKGLFKWRVGPTWYAFALGFPAFLVAVTSLGYLLLGHDLSLSMLPGKLLAYVPTLVLLVTIGGGNEEPGWRGFGLGELQRVHSPLVATLILGSIWALWHLPLLTTSPHVMSGEASLSEIALLVGVTFISIAAHAFWYTWLINRTGSVLLCMLLHGGYNAANGLLLLVPETEVVANYPTLLALTTTVLVISVFLLVVFTRGRLGQ